LRSFAVDSRQTTTSYLAGRYGSTKLYWRWTSENVARLNLFARFNFYTARPVEISFSFKLFHVGYCISWKCSDPNCSSQGQSSLHPPSKLLLRSLATTDLCVGLVAEPIAVTVWMSLVKENWSICRYALATCLITSYTLCGASVATLTVISVDRLLALLVGLRYRQVVTLKRTYVIVITFWFLPAVFSAMYFWNPLIVTFWYGIIYIPLCLTISIFSYTKIFFTLRHHQNQVQDHFEQTN